MSKEMQYIADCQAMPFDNTHVGGWCGQIRKTSKRFDSEKKMWRESYILFNFLELIVYKVMQGYPCPMYKVITKYKLIFYDRK